MRKWSSTVTTAGQARLLNDLGAHDKVLIEELAWASPIRADAADQGSQMNDRVRMQVVHTCGDLVRIGQVVVGMARGSAPSARSGCPRRETTAPTAFRSLSRRASYSMSNRGCTVTRSIAASFLRVTTPA
jgi:hypothetical protein